VQRVAPFPAEQTEEAAPHSVPSSSAPPLIRAGARRWVIGVAVVVFIVLLQAAAQIFAGRERARVVAHLVFLSIELPTLMAALGASFNWAVKKRLPAWRTLLLGVFVSALIGLTFGIGYGLVMHSFPTFHNHGVEQTVLTSAMFGLTYAQLHFGLWTLAFVYPFAAEDARLRALEAERLRSAAELARLRANLEPHFLLNTLNAIAGLVTEEPRRARQLIASLGDLLRDSLQNDGELRELGREIDWLKRYADVIETRYGGAIQFSWELDERANDVKVPTLLLQPLLENAVKHGALRSGDGGGRVSVRSRIQKDGSKPRLFLEIEDNGPGVRNQPTRSGAFGLHAVRRRLELRCPDSALHIEPSPSGGTRSVIEIGIGPQEANR
jgi:hypothetical protein